MSIESEKYYLFEDKILYKVTGPCKRHLLKINSTLVYKVIKIDRTTSKETNIGKVPILLIDEDIRKGILKEYNYGY